MQFVLAIGFIGLVLVSGLFVGFTKEIARLRRGVHPMPKKRKKAIVIEMSKREKMWIGRSAALLLALVLATPSLHSQDVSDTKPETTKPEPSKTGIEWQYGGFLDAAYLYNFNTPTNHLFRSRGTTYKVDEPILNMAAAYLRKTASEDSRWGLELTVLGGQDTRVFGFSATAPNMPGYRGLRHLGPTNVSYLAPIDRGLTIQGGIFSSFIGYDSLFAKDNFNYTRPWGADFTPYYMLGVNATYPFTDKLTGTFFVINGYWHLANANSVPTFGGQVAYKVAPKWTLKQTAMYGPHQADTSIELWRFLSDSIVEWKAEKTTVAFEYHFGLENVATTPEVQAFWSGAQMPMKRVLNDRWSIALRPEFYWDRDGRLTLARQRVLALTSTLEYKLPVKQSSMIFRLEHRLDDSRGPEGGFFKDGFVTPGVVGLTPRQNLLMLGVIWTIDGKFRR
jgi:hypothetical protein